MNDCSALTIRAWDAEHDRLGFQCGVTSLDNYIKKQARQDIKRHISRVFVVSAALLGRLAVNKESQKNGVGKLLLVDALKRTLAVSNEIAICDGR